MHPRLQFLPALLISLIFITASPARAGSFTDECPAPTNLLFTDITLNTVTIHWDGPPEMFYELSLFSSRTGDVVYGFTFGNSLFFDQLDSNSEYEVRIFAYCPYFVTSDITFGSFTTLPDCSPVTNVMVQAFSDSVHISFDAHEISSVAMTLFQAGVEAESIILESERVAWFTGLSAETEYHIRITVTCLDLSESVSWHSFTTLPYPWSVDYCSSKGADSDKSFIQSLMLADVRHISGNDGGYADNTSVVMALEVGGAYNISLRPGGLPSRKYAAVWVDFDADGYFGGVNEQVAWWAINRGDEVTSAFTVPQDAIPGTTRMRVIVSQYKDFQSCGIYNRGETEDYTVMINPPTSSHSFSVYPNPAAHQIRMGGLHTTETVVVKNAGGEIMFRGKCPQFIDISSWPDGMYYISARSGSVRLIKTQP
jgi:bacillolysin